MRLVKTLQSAGLPCKGLLEGIPQFSRKLTQEEQGLADKIVAAHEPDDAVFVSKDLDKDAADVKLALTAEQWEKYCALKDDVVAERAGVPKVVLKLMDVIIATQDLAALQTAVTILRQELDDAV